jgi:predicted nucleotidyltransferase
MMLMAHFITHQTTMFVDRGYIRDFVIFGSLETDGRGNVQSDLDASIGQESLESGLEMLSQFAKQHQIKLKRHQSKGPKVLEAFFEPTGGKEFPIKR